MHPAEWRNTRWRSVLSSISILEKMIEKMDGIILSSTLNDGDSMLME